jgi:hypothetical protein
LPGETGSAATSGGRKGASKTSCTGALARLPKQSFHPLNLQPSTIGKGESMSPKSEAKEAKETESKGAKAQEQPAQATVVWDDSNMTSSYSNVCNVSSTREEVTLLFGTNQNWHTGQQEFKVLLTNRVILNPYAAKRLSMLLTNIMKEYESRFGPLQVEAAGGGTK